MAHQKTSITTSKFCVKCWQTKLYVKKSKREKTTKLFSGTRKTIKKNKNYDLKLLVRFQVTILKNCKKKPFELFRFFDRDFTQQCF